MKLYPIAKRAAGGLLVLVLASACAPEPAATTLADEPPEATGETCKNANMAKLSGSAREKLQKACFRRGNLNRPNSGKTW